MATHSSIPAWRIPWTENPMDRGAWWATLVHGVAKSLTRLSDLKKNQKQYCNKFTDDFKMVHIKKSLLKEKNASELLSKTHQYCHRWGF